MIPSRIALILFGILLSTMVRAQPPGGADALLSGGQLLQHCMGTQKWDQAACYYYAVGLADMANLATALGGSIGGARVCLPQGIAFFAMHDSIVRYLKAHPKELRQGAPGLAMVALAKAFRCP